MTRKIDDGEMGGLRFSFREIIFWSVVISFILASPAWFGESSILICFYATLALTAWRFSKFMPVIVAGVLGLTVAVITSALMVGWVQG